MGRRRDRQYKWLTNLYGFNSVGIVGRLDFLTINEVEWAEMGCSEVTHLRTVGQVFLTGVAGPTFVSEALRENLFNENTGVPADPGDIQTADGVEGQSIMWLRHKTTAIVPAQYDALPWHHMIDCRVKRRLRRPFTVTYCIQAAAATSVVGYLRTLVEMH